MFPTLNSPELLPERPHRGLTSDAMRFINKKFIGAVQDVWTLYSDEAADYTIGEPIGFGASSTVYAATYHPSATDPHNPPSIPIPCALKVLDLDLLPRRSLQLLQRETTLMSLSKHPNVLRVRGSWIAGHKLYIALRLMNKGSAADVMRYGWPGGMEEDVVRCILQQALQGLNYLHVNGFIHRDIKAANLLVDDDGTVLLGDLGVAADLSEDSSRHTGSTVTHSTSTYVISSTKQTQSKPSVAFQSRPKIGKRKSFVGTPCWMAPELIEGRQYDSAADIWSFGITALELCQGRPPKSRESPKNVLVRVIQDAPPTLDREGGTYKYSRAFKEIIDGCLVKDPSKRPTAEELLQTPFFRGAKKKSYLISTILKDLPPLTQRQERRSSHHPSTVATIDSWDFTTTVHSQTNTIILPRNRVIEEVVLSKPEYEVFHLEVDDEKQDPQAGNCPLTSSPSSSSYEGDISTDTAGGRHSTPATNSSSFTGSPLSPKSIPSSPGIPSAVVPHSEESVKKGFWSRLSSGKRRSSVSNIKGLGTSPPAMPNSEYPDGTARSPPPVCSNVDQKEALGRMSKLIPVREPLKVSTTSPSIVGQRFRPTSASGVFNNCTAGSPGKDGAKVGNGTFKVRRPSSSKGNLFGGIIDEAKNRLVKS